MPYPDSSECNSKNGHPAVYNLQTKVLIRIESPAAAVTFTRFAIPVIQLISCVMNCGWTHDDLKLITASTEQIDHENVHMKSHEWGLPDET